MHFPGYSLYLFLSKIQEKKYKLLYLTLYLFFAKTGKINTGYASETKPKQTNHLNLFINFFSLSRRRGSNSKKVFQVADRSFSETVLQR